MRFGAAAGHLQRGGSGDPPRTASSCAVVLTGAVVPGRREHGAVGVPGGRGRPPRRGSEAVSRRETCASAQRRKSSPDRPSLRVKSAVEPVRRYISATHADSDHRCQVSVFRRDARRVSRPEPGAVRCRPALPAPALVNRAIIRYRPGKGRENVKNTQLTAILHSDFLELPWLSVYTACYPTAQTTRSPGCKELTPWQNQDL
jgi:hypothetical protein